MRSLLTGSRVYGTPKDTSDLDMVVQFTEDEWFAFRLAFGMKIVSEDGASASGSPAIEETIRLDKLNIIVVLRDWQFGVWEQGTKFLIREVKTTGKPISRERAVQVFQSLERGEMLMNETKNTAAAQTTTGPVDGANVPEKAASPPPPDLNVKTSSVGRKNVVENVNAKASKTYYYGEDDLKMRFVQYVTGFGNAKGKTEEERLQWIAAHAINRLTIIENERLNALAATEAKAAGKSMPAKDTTAVTHGC